MPPSVARRPQHGPSTKAGDSPLVVYVASSLDGTSFALNPTSQVQVREKFPKTRVTTRRIFISHDTREAFDQSIHRFEDQIAVLLTGVPADELVRAFGATSFRDPQSEAEIARLPVLKRAARRA